MDAGEIVQGREVLEGVDPCRGCRYVRDPTLTLMRVLDAAGQPVRDAMVGVKTLDFPLRTGKAWTQGVHRFRVEAYETIVVKAGRFDAFRINRTVTNSSTGWQGHARAWWAPSVRWYVRLEAIRGSSLDAGGEAGADLELESYSLK